MNLKSCFIFDFQKTYADFHKGLLLYNNKNIYKNLRSACKSNDFLTARFSTLLERSVYIVPKIVRNYQPMDKLLENIDNCK